jgi:hypothetical protein
MQIKSKCKFLLYGMKEKQKCSHLIAGSYISVVGRESKIWLSKKVYTAMACPLSGAGAHP